APGATPVPHQGGTSAKKISKILCAIAREIADAQVLGSGWEFWKITRLVMPAQRVFIEHAGAVTIAHDEVEGNGIGDLTDHRARHSGSGNKGNSLGLRHETGLRLIAEQHRPGA